VSWVGDEIALRRLGHTLNDVSHSPSVTSRRNDSFENFPDFRLRIRVLNILCGSRQHKNPMVEV
jgi:hypothetical protein